MGRKNILDKMIDRADDVNRDLRKATRRTLKSKKKKKNKDKGARKLARRNSKDIQALAAQVALLARNVSTPAEKESAAGSTLPSAGRKA